MATAIARSVFPDLADLRDAYGIDVPELFDANDFEGRGCALCGTPPLPPRATLDVAERWFSTYDPDLAYLQEIGGPASDIIIGRFGPNIEPGISPMLISRASKDSSLEPRLPIPPEYLEAIAGGLDDVDYATLVRCIAPVCARCEFDGSDGVAEIDQTLERIYVENVFEGNRDVAVAQAVWPDAADLFKRIRLVSDRLRRTG